MIKSMTGFGRSEHRDEHRNILVEIKSVNHRYGEISVRISRKYAFVEEKIKAAVKSKVKRGKVDVSVMIDSLTDADNTISLNLDIARQYQENLCRLKDELCLAGDVDTKLLAGMPEVIRGIPEGLDEDEISESVLSVVRDAVENLDSMRCTEGAKLAEDILDRGEAIRKSLAEIEKNADKMVEDYCTKLKDRISDLLKGSVEIPEERILVEAAIFADKANINEEIVRLNSHLDQLAKIVNEAKQPEGKKLDFLVQEMNREANTIGSKANSLEITNLMLEIKSEVEKIREQVQNVE